jgi:PST family polysaccharide transporter
MTLVKTSFLNAIAVAIRILTSLALNKILAVQIGAGGYAVMGQFQNFVNMLTTVAGGAVNTGVTKYTAENYHDNDRQILFWRTAGSVALIGSAVAGIALALFNAPLSVLILADPRYGNVFIWLGAGIVLFAFNALLLSILNGKKEIGRYIVANIASSALSLLVTGGLALYGGIRGALIALSVNQSVVFFVTLAICWRTPWFKLRFLFGQIDTTALRALSKYTLMTLTSALCIPASQILIRNHLGEKFGLPIAGHWEALMRISSLYLMVVTTPLAVYYLPRLSEIRDRKELWKEVFQGYRLILPVTAAGAFSIYLLRDILIRTLFTAEFSPMRDLFAWQMIGDTVKIGSWLLGYIMLGRAMTKIYVITEIIFSASWVGLVWLMSDCFGPQGAQIGYFLNYIFYWLTLAFLIARYAR